MRKLHEPLRCHPGEPEAGRNFDDADEFLRFIQAKPPEGLGTTPEQVKVFLEGHNDLLDLWNRLTVKPQGSNNNPTGVNQHTPGPSQHEAEEVNHYNVMVDQTSEPKEELDREKVTDRPRDPLKPKQGNDSMYALRKLRSNAPEIHARVLSGELSPNAGMDLAVFRAPVFQVPVEPIAAARRLTRYFTREQFDLASDVQRPIISRPRAIGAYRGREQLRRRSGEPRRRILRAIVEVLRMRLSVVVLPGYPGQFERIISGRLYIATLAYRQNRGEQSIDLLLARSKLHLPRRRQRGGL